MLMETNVARKYLRACARHCGRKKTHGGVGPNKLSALKNARTVIGGPAQNLSLVVESVFSKRGQLL